MARLVETVMHQLDAIRCAVARDFQHSLAGTGFRPKEARALALVKERPGCDQAALGRALIGNRSLGMKVASRLEAKGLLIRRDGRDGRCKGLFLTPQGERVLGELPKPGEGLTDGMATGLEPAEWEALCSLLSKVQGTFEAKGKHLAPPLRRERRPGPTGDS